MEGGEYLVHDRITVTATFYSCLGDSTGSYCPGDLTASGAPLGPPDSKALACGAGFPLGTRLLVPGYGEATCIDRGHLAHWQVDAWFNDAADGWAWLAAVGTQIEVEVIW